MPDEDIKSLIQQFSNSADRWTTQLLESVYRNSEILMKNSERGFNLVLTITTICSAFLAIVVPLIKDNLSPILNTTIIFFFFTSIIGIIGLVLTVKRDKRVLLEEAEWEHATLSKYQKYALDISSKLSEYKDKRNVELLSQIKVEVKNYFEEGKKLDIEAKERKEKREKEFSALTLKYLNIFFWGCFTVAIVTLSLWLYLQIFK